MPAATNPTQPLLTGFYWHNASNSQSYQYLFDQHQLHSEAFADVLSAPWQAVAQGDFNGDGEDDLFWRNSQTGANKIQLLTGGKTLSAHDIKTVGDLDGDKTDDLLWAHPASTELYSFQIKNAALVKESLVLRITTPGWTLAAAQDFNADGKTDLLFKNSLTGVNYLLRMNGSAVVSESFAPSVTDLTWQLLGAADLNGDTYPDMVWRNQQTGDNYFHLLKDTQVIGEGFLPSEPNLNWNLFKLVDLDGDAKADQVWLNRQTHQVAVLTLDAQAKASKNYIAMTGSAGWQLRFLPRVKAPVP